MQFRPHQQHFAVFQLAAHVFHFLFQRTFMLAVVGTFAQHKGLDQAIEGLGFQFFPGDDHLVVSR
ncbi:hypothetical protein D3C85_1926720 [compost metagenome]